MQSQENRDRFAANLAYAESLLSTVRECLEPLGVTIAFGPESRQGDPTQAVWEFHHGGEWLLRYWPRTCKWKAKGWLEGEERDPLRIVNVMQETIARTAAYKALVLHRNMPGQVTDYSAFLYKNSGETPIFVDAVVFPGN